MVGGHLKGGEGMCCRLGLGGGGMTFPPWGGNSAGTTALVEGHFVRIGLLISMTSLKISG